MKQKIRKMANLKLNRETLRVLEDREVGAIAGGVSANGGGCVVTTHCPTGICLPSQGVGGTCTTTTTAA